MTAAASRTLVPPSLDDIHRARERIGAGATATPLVGLETDAGEPEIWLKLENLHPIGSFKLRGALSRIGAIAREVHDRLQGKRRAHGLLRTRSLKIALLR